MAIFIRINGKSVDAESLSPKERQEMVDAYRKRLKGMKGIEALKLKRIIAAISAINRRLNVELKSQKKKQKQRSIGSLVSGIGGDEKTGRYAGGQGAVQFVPGGNPGSKR